LREKYHYENLVGKSEAMQRVFRMIRQVSQSRSTVLLQGKSGTGKELVARAIHFNSPQAAGPMVTVDCGAIAPTVIESELFGHVKGAFTGAIQAKEGLFRMARGGTLFFDEIGELPLEMQTKLLRALQEREIRPVGSDRTHPVDVRVIAATHKDLEAGVRDGRFREDLYYRLNVITIHVPALADRKGDIPHLLAHFLKKHHGRRNVERIEAQAMQALMAYDWPGNVRELENAVERAIALGQGPTVVCADLPPQIAAKYTESMEQQPALHVPAGAEPANGHFTAEPELPPGDMVLNAIDSDEQSFENNTPLAPPARNELASLFTEAALSGQNKLDDIEKQAIMATLRITGGDRTACAKILGIDKSTLYRKLKRYNFEFAGGEQSETA
jgi:DNA-binding NtrC family response regulator